MRQTVQYDHAREERLETYYRRQTASLMRKDAALKTVDEALGLTQDVRLPRFSVEFRLGEDVEYMPGRWGLATGLGTAFENYVARLCEMEKVRFANSVVGGLMPAHHKAFDDVVEAAHTLEKLGWPVNWQQNIQTILEPTEYGIRDGKLIDRFVGQPEHTTLGDELLLLGTVTFYQQNRSADGLTTPFKARVMTATNRALHEATQILLRNDQDDLPARFTYSSEWLPGRSGRSYRIAV